MRILIVTAVAAEAAVVPELDGVKIIVAGIGRTNAAAATTEALVRASLNGRRFDVVINAGIAGALPESGLELGRPLVASACIYVEEGIATSHGFAGMAGLGFALGDFAGNAVPVDPSLLDALSALFPIGPIATVATCSGTDAAAAEVQRRTGGALAEAMEGAAAIHSARRLNTPAIELRTISNTTGDRARQRWDIAAALEALGPAVAKAVAAIRA